MTGSNTASRLLVPVIENRHRVLAHDLGVEVRDGAHQHLTPLCKGLLNAAR